MCIVVIIIIIPAIVFVFFDNHICRAHDNRHLWAYLINKTSGRSEFKSVLWRVTRKRRGLERTNSDLKAATALVVSRCATIIYMYVYTVHSDSRTCYSTYWHMSSSSKTQVFKDYTNYQCYFRSLWLEGKVAYIYIFVYIYTYMMCVCIYCIYIL